MRTALRAKLSILVLASATPGFARAAGASAGDPVKGRGPTVQLSNRSSPVPLFSEEYGSVPVAVVGDDDAITVREFAEILAEAHSDRESTSGKKLDFAPLLDRLVDVRLIVREARAMGMDELPQVQKALADYRSSTLRDTVRHRAMRTAKGDPKAVERLYRERVRQWKIQSVLFHREEEAKAFARRSLTPAAFSEASARLVKEHKASDRSEGQIIQRTGAHVAVLQAVQKLKRGQVSPPVKVPQGFAVLLIEEVQYPDIPAARADAEKDVAEPLRLKALRAHYEALVKRFATVDKKLLKSLDYDAEKPGIAALAKDLRVLVRIQGEAPITVADLTAELQKKYYHGVEQAAKERKINRNKDELFDSVLARRLFEKEARAEGVADSEPYHRAVAEFERSLLFGTFVERAVIPEVKVTEAQARAYYNSHQDEFLYPELYTLETLAFPTAGEAQAACAKLQAGTDVKWLKANADNQLPAAKRTIEVAGTSVTASSMPEGLAAILAGTKPGDCRIFPRAQGECYAVQVVARTERKAQPFAEARPTIEPKLFQQNIAASVADWAKKLRGAYPVKIFIRAVDV
jgi:PPIC-type PPIASE domain